MEIETPVLLAYAIEDFTDIFRISGGVWTPQTPPSRCATAEKCSGWEGRSLPINHVSVAAVLSCPHIYLFSIYVSPDHPAPSWLLHTGSLSELQWRHTPFSGWCHNLEHSESVQNSFSAR